MPNSTQNVLNLFAAAPAPKANSTVAKEEVHPARNNVVTSFLQRRVAAMSKPIGWKDPAQELLSQTLLEARDLFASLEILLRTAKQWNRPLPMKLSEENHQKLDALCNLMDQFSGRESEGRMVELRTICKIARAWRSQYVLPQEAPQPQMAPGSFFNPRPR